MKENIKDFIKNIMNRNYSNASKNLSTVIDKKIERHIINNNTKIF